MKQQTDAPQVLQERKSTNGAGAEQNSLKHFSRAEAAEVLDTIAGIPELQEFHGFAGDMARLRARLIDSEFRIAVVGEFSSGKSTFINAMLGRDLLQHAISETTATITRIINVSADDERAGTGRVIFRDGTEKAMSDLSGLRQFTTTFSTEHNVVQEVAGVDVFYPIVSDDRQLVLVDTPGLNGTADGHREQTIQLVQQAHACIYLLQRRGIAESDEAFLRYLAKYQKHFVFVQNFIDDFRRMEGETVEGKKAEQRLILRDVVFKDESDVAYEVCGVSALKALAARDTSIRKLYSDSPRELTTADRASLEESSNFSEFEMLLDNMFRQDKLQEMQFMDTVAAVADWLQTVEARTDMRHQQADEVYRASQQGRADRRLEDSRNKILGRVDSQKQYLRSFVGAQMHRLEVDERRNVEVELRKIYERHRQKIAALKDLDELKSWEVRLPQELQTDVQSVQDNRVERLRLELSRTRQILMARIEEYSGINAGDLSELELTLNDQIKQTAAELQLRDELSELKKHILDAEDRREDLQSQKNRLEDNIRQAEEAMTSAEREKKQTINDHRRRIASLGLRPDAKTITEEYETYEDRTGIGHAFQWLVGQKKIKHTLSWSDDSEGENWDRDRARIDRDYAEKKTVATRKLNAALRRYEELRSNGDHCEEQIKSCQRRIERKQADLKQVEELIEKERHVARAELLRVSKTSMQQQIDAYLFGDSGIEEQIGDSVRALLSRVRENLEEQALERFDDAVKRRLENMRDAQEKQPSDLRDKTRRWQDIHERVSEARRRMEDMMCGR